MPPIRLRQATQHPPRVFCLVGLAAMPNLGTVHFTSATLNRANPGFHPVDGIQPVTSNGTVVATPSAPGPR